MRKRSEQIHSRVSSATLQLTVSLLYHPEVRKILKELINEVNRIGININQIVFNNNAGLYSKEDKTQLIPYMRKLNQKVDEAVVKIGNQ